MEEDICVHQMRRWKLLSGMKCQSNTGRKFVNMEHEYIGHSFHNFFDMIDWLMNTK